MDTAYLKLTAGSRLKNYMGLVVDEGQEYKFGMNYLHLDIPVRPTDEYKDVKRNQHVFVEAAAIVNVKGRNIIEVEPNPLLAEFGQVQGSYKIHPGSGEKRLGFWFTARKDIDLSTLDYAVRLYMVS